MKSSLIIILFFAAGITAGLLMNGSDLSIGSGMSNYALHFLLFLIGISIGSDLKVFKIIKKLHFKVLLVPFMVTFFL